MTLLRAAKAWGDQPTDLLLGDHVGSVELRRRLNTKLKVALQLLEDETCPQCGHPIWICHATLNTIKFDVETGTCYADMELEKWKDSVKWGQKGGLNEPGSEPYTVVRIVGGGPWPTRAEGLESIG